MITLHHLENSRSLGLLWLLEEMGLDYELQIHARDPKTNLSPESYKKLHPLGKAPVLQDDDLILAESGAIVEYLLDTYDPQNQFRPAAGTPARRRYQYWLHAAEGSLMPHGNEATLFHAPHRQSRDRASAQALSHTYQDQYARLYQRRTGRSHLVCGRRIHRC